MAGQLRLTELISLSLDRQLSSEEQDEQRALIERDTISWKLRDVMFAIHSMLGNPSDAMDARMPGETKDRLRQRVQGASTLAQAGHKN